MLSIQSMVSQIVSLPLERQQALAQRVYHVLDVKGALTDTDPTIRTADLASIDWQQLLQTLLTDAPEILALIQEVLALTGG